jgi:type I restriction enzyme, S subunit
MNSDAASPLWPLEPLCELIAIHHGYAFAGEHFNEDGHGDVLVTPGNFAIGGGFTWGKGKYYEGPVDERFVLSAGDLVVTMTDLSKASDTLGSPALIPEHPAGKRLLHNQRIGRVEVIAPDRVDVAYLYATLRSEAYRRQVVASATGTTVKHTAPRPRTTSERRQRLRHSLMSASSRRSRVPTRPRIFLQDGNAGPSLTSRFCIAS